MDKAQEFREAFSKTLGRPPAENVPLADFSSFRIGGPADYLFDALSRDELIAAAALAARANVPYYLTGGGFNLLFHDEGYRGLIIRNKAEGVDFGEGRVSALSGTGLSRLLQECLAHGLSGLEFLAGIPGTVGGALFGNAGAFGCSIGDFAESAVILSPDGAVGKISKEDLNFEYRRSSLRDNHAIVLGADLAVFPGDSKASETKIHDYLERRRTKHPPRGTACAGSYFKNPCFAGGKKVAAGMLLEQAGARGMAVGGAAVYEGHCNFIVNTGNATARDVLALAANLKERVYEKFDVRLEEEVIYLPAIASIL